MSCKINKENNFITFFFFILLPFINRDRPANGLFLCPVIRRQGIAFVDHAAGQSETEHLAALFYAPGQRRLRKGGLDIPFMFLMNSLLGVNGIVWATPIADFSAMTAAVCSCKSIKVRSASRKCFEIIWEDFPALFPG